MQNVASFVRPAALAYTLLLLGACIVAEWFGHSLRELWIKLLADLLEVQLLAYTCGRSLEKITTTIKGQSNDAP